jgi:predicted transcriptional regulator
MKTLSINQFDKKDEEIVYALISLGMSKPAARMIAYIHNMAQLQHCCHQPPHKF